MVSRGTRPKPVCLIILDGFGAAPGGPTNAITLAKTPHFDRYYSTHPNTTLGAAGPDVGLPDGQMGNSEVGHLNIGAGRVVYQEFTRISAAIADRAFFRNPVLIEAFGKARELGGAVHLMGLVSDGGVHSHNMHLYALLGMAADQDLPDVFVHAFLDGRDVPPQSAVGYLRELEDKMAEIGAGRVATVSGRYYAMDRDRRWERTKLAYDAIVHGIGGTAPDAVSAVEQSYDAGVVDEFVVPTVISGAGRAGSDDGRPRKTDAVIFFNFRPDRARQLTAAVALAEFEGFDRGARPHVYFACMTEYDATFNLPVAFPPEALKNILADVLAQHGLTQLHTAETEKYAHVTFFFNGGVETPKPGEDRALVASPKVATYDLRPEMSAREVGDIVVKAVAEGRHDFIVVNFANPDMVGHTGILPAAVNAIEAIDAQVGRIVDAVRDRGGETVIIADHGNAEAMTDPQGRPWTAHTTNRVPFIYIGRPAAVADGGRLADVAPTLLAMMDIPIPAEMTGRSLLRFV